MLAAAGKGNVPVGFAHGLLVLGHVEEEQVQLVGRGAVAGFHEKPPAEVPFHGRHHPLVSAECLLRQILRIQEDRLAVPQDHLAVEPNKAVGRGGQRKAPAGSGQSFWIHRPKLFQECNLLRRQTGVELLERDQRGGAQFLALINKWIERLHDRLPHGKFLLIESIQRDRQRRSGKQEEDCERNPHLQMEPHRFHISIIIETMKIVRGFVLLFLFFATLTHAYAEEPKFPYLARVSAPVVNLRKEPVKAAHTFEHDPLEETQLLYGEPVKVLGESGEWVRVEAVEQQEWTHNKRWEGYPGWVEKTQLVLEPLNGSPNLLIISKEGAVRPEPRSNAPALLTLSICSRLTALSSNLVHWQRVRLLDGSIGWIEAEVVTQTPIQFPNYPLLRQKLVRAARLFLGDPYYWGGRSSTAVDCSGLVGLAHQVNGIQIPRDAHEQRMKARPLNRDQLKAGDLVFLSEKEEPEKITHVMMYIGDGKVIEGPGTGQAVREIDLDERLKESAGRRVSYGTFLPS